MSYIAKPTIAPANAEIVGQAVLDWVNNLEGEMTRPIFKRFNLDANDINPKGWYSLDIIAQLYAAIQGSPNGSNALVAMGKASAPPVVAMMQFTSPQDFIKRSREPFVASLRNIPDEYGFLINKINKHTYDVTNNTIVPNSMIYGYIWGVMAELRNSIESFAVRPISGYEDGGNVGATFEVSWK